MSDAQAPLGLGIHYGIPATRYHSDPCPTPSLSSGIARTLISQSPAAAYREHPKLGGKRRESTTAMDTGSLVHSLLANNQDDFEIGNFDNFRSKAIETMGTNNKLIQEQLQRSEGYLDRVRQQQAKAAVAGGATLAATWAAFDEDGRDFWTGMDALVDMLDGLTPAEDADA